MAVLALSFLTFVAVCVCGGIERSESGNFPLHGCTTEKMDILFLYSDSFYDTTVYGDQKTLTYDFANGWLRSSKAKSGVLIGDVYDSYSVSNPAVNVSSWQFYYLERYVVYARKDMVGLLPPYSFTFPKKPYKKYHNSANNNLPRKIQFVQRLFAEMTGSRENATHVAVIFLNGGELSFEQTRSFPHIIDQQKQDTDIKIFVVVFDVKYVSHLVYLKDTLLVGYNSKHLLGQILVMAICDKCSEGWFRFRQTDQLSCYLPLAFKSVKDDWESGRSTCKDGYSSLATMETKEEMQYLQHQMSKYLRGSKYLRYYTKNTSQLAVHFVIGLKKTTIKIAKRFHWYGEITNKYSPLVVNHWLLGKPSADNINGCGAWLFVYNNISNDVSNTSGNDNHVVDGWVDVRCRDKISSFSLCEVTLPRRVEDKQIMIIKPASNESFTQALTKGDFIIFRDNIVSVSANIANKDFLGFLRKSEQELFPLFDCGEDSLDSQYISYVYVCDFIDHCSNRRDELLCFYQSDNNFNTKVNVIFCCDDSLLPVSWVGDGEVDCNVCGYSKNKDINDESQTLVDSFKKKDCAFYCGYQCVSFKELNNNKTDCRGKEGNIDETIGKLETMDSCYNSLGHRLWSPKCVYLKDMFGGLMGCRDLSHLDNCTDFECPEGYVKCVNTYCIPQHYVFDGTLDCPTGDDENNYTFSSCTGNFACWNSKMCLHPDLVCDGYPDCPHRDDEVDCGLFCVDGFRCISGTATVKDYNKPIPKLTTKNFNPRTRYMDLSHVTLNREFYSNQNLIIFILSHCNLTSSRIYKEFLPNGLQILDVSYNRLQYLDGYEIYDSPLDNVRVLNLSYNKEFVEIKNMQLILLETIDLSHTSLSLLNKSFVLMFPGLKHLNLSFTKIRSINGYTFPHNIIYQSLDLRGLIIADFYEDYFSGLSISHDLFTDSFRLCCPQIRGMLIPYHTCHSPDDAISSCLDLIGIDVQRVLLWVVAVLAVFGNITVIGYRVICDRSVLRTGYGLFVTNLGISDFIMGVYLFIIAGADYYYRDIYVLYDESWRESVVCKLAGFLATLSSETSTLCVFLITLDRFLILKFPFGQVKFSKMSKIIVLSLSWIIGFLLALTPIVFRFEIYSSNAMCLGLPLTTKRFNGWEFTFAVFIVLNISLVLIIAYGQRVIFRAMSENRMNHTSSRRANDLTVAKQLFLVALSNFVCWFPVGIMGLLTLGGHVISNDAYAWTTVIVLPINSGANPLLYTIPAIMAKWEQFKHGGSRAIKTST